MDTRILPLERETVHLDAWTLGGATPASRNLGARPMGSPRWRLGLGQRILALGRAAILQPHVEHLSPSLQKTSSGIIPEGSSFFDGHVL